MTVEVKVHAFPRCRGVLAIWAEHPNLPEDRAVLRVEKEVWGVLALCFWQDGGWRTRNAQIEENFPLQGVVLLLEMDVIRRGKVREEGQRLRCRVHGRALGRGAIWGRALRSRINGVLFDGMSSNMTDLLWRGYPLGVLGRFEGGLSVVCEDHGVVRGCRCERVIERRMGATASIE
jgi:hypothetical protein